MSRVRTISLPASWRCSPSSSLSTATMRWEYFFPCVISYYFVSFYVIGSLVDGCCKEGWILAAFCQCFGSWCDVLFPFLYLSEWVAAHISWAGKRVDLEGQPRAKIWWENINVKLADKGVVRLRCDSFRIELKLYWVLSKISLDSWSYWLSWVDG